MIHAYQKFDPVNFPPPQQDAPDLVSPAFEQALWEGGFSDLTEEDLARAVRLDPSQIAGLGPSLDSLRAMLEERKRKILSTYELRSVQKKARVALHDNVRKIKVPKNTRSSTGKQLFKSNLICLKGSGTMQETTRAS